MIQQHIDSTARYEFNKFILNSGEQLFSKFSKHLLTVFIHKGIGDLTIQMKNGNIKKYKISSMEGFIIAPEISYTLTATNSLIAYQVKSPLDDYQDIVELYDHGGVIDEISITDYKIIKNPKRVNKPWGHELWILWTKNHHVLKQLNMNAGFRTSLQFHRRKLETIYIHTGEVDVISGFKIDPDEPNENIDTFVKNVNFDSYTSRFKDGDSWHLAPGNVHRIIAVKDFTSYEVSTPELDDVIRINDDFGRVSGRIKSEHQ